jgi:tetratricopeptide (TPR) repeat protein
MALIQNGRAADGIDYINRIMRLDPFHPDLYVTWLGLAYYLVGRGAEAVENLRIAVRRLPTFRPAHIWRAAAAARAGEDEEAQSAAAEVLRLEPKFTVGKWLTMHRFANQADAERISEDLRMAGLPD